MGSNLRDRAAQNAAASGLARRGDVPPPGGDVEPATLAEQIETWQAEFQLAMPTGAEARLIVRDALHLLRTTRDLAQCTPSSVLGGLMTFAQLNLRPGVLGQGWLIPFRNWQKAGRPLEAQIVIGYQGFVQLVHRAGERVKVVGRARHERDLLRVVYGTDERIEHEPYMGPDGRGDVTGYYAIIRHGDSEPIPWFMSTDEALDWRDEHAMAVKRAKGGGVLRDDDGRALGSGPWWDFSGPQGGRGFDQMAIKTCFLRAKRWAAMGISADLDRAAAVDGGVRLGVQDPTDPDEMFDAEHARNSDVVIDAEPEPARERTTARGPAATQDGERRAARPPVHDVGTPAAQAGPAPSAPRLVTEFPAPPATGTEEPVRTHITSQIARLIARAGISDDVERLAIIGRMCGRTSPITSSKDLTAPEGRQVLQLLSGWEDAGIIDAQLAAVLAATSAQVPAVGSPGWHDARHPRTDSDGQTVTADRDMSGDCGICEQEHGR